MPEIHQKPEVIDSPKPEAASFRDIKPQTDMTVSQAKSFIADQFKGDDLRADDQGSEIRGEPKQYVDDLGKVYRVGNELLPNIQFEHNGYTYKTDDSGRIVSAEGKLQKRNHEGRNEVKESRDTVAHGKMADTDDMGHLIADRFNGSNELENLVPMDFRLNRGDYAKLEKTLADAVKDGADVRMKVEPVYEGDLYRPTEIKVSYSIDGEKDVTVFKNGSGD